VVSWPAEARLNIATARPLKAATYTVVPPGLTATEMAPVSEGGPDAAQPSLETQPP
jgi:hypothetical protein